MKSWNWTPTSSARRNTSTTTTSTANTATTPATIMATATITTAHITPTTSPPSSSKARAPSTPPNWKNSSTALSRSTVRACCATKAYCGCTVANARWCSRACTRSWAATSAPNGAKPTSVAAKWYLLAKIYRKTSLLADWNNVWYKLSGFYGGGPGQLERY